MIFKNKLVKKINLKIEKLDILKKTKSVGIEVSKQKYDEQFRVRKKSN